MAPMRIRSDCPHEVEIEPACGEAHKSEETRGHS